MSTPTHTNIVCEPPNRFVLNSKSKKAKPHTVSIEWFCMAMNWLGLIMSSKKFHFYSKFAVSTSCCCTNVLIKFFQNFSLQKLTGIYGLSLKSTAYAKLYETHCLLSCDSLSTAEKWFSQQIEDYSFCYFFNFHRA